MIRPLFLIGLFLLGVRAAPSQVVGGDSDTLWSNLSQMFGLSSHQRLQTWEVSGDGLLDLLIGSKHRIQAIDGSSGQLLWETPVASGLFQVTDDLDGDGVQDIVNLADLGSSGWPHLRAEYYSGADGALITDHIVYSGGPPFGLVGMIPAGDLDQDGTPDFHLARDTGEITTWLGGTGQFPRRITAAGEALGMWALGDLDGDQVTDFAFSTADAAAGTHSLHVHSGADLQEIRVHRDSRLSDPAQLGCSPTGDRNGDGVADYVTTGMEMDLGGPASGSLSWISGADGQVIWSRDTLKQEVCFGFHALAYPDWDGDGVEDLIVCGTEENQPWIWRMVSVLSGADGSKLIDLEAFAGSEEHVVLLSDLNTDGLPEVASALPHASGRLIQAVSVMPGLRVSPGQLSVGQGGRLFFWIQLPRRFAGDSYQLLGSGAGVGPSSFGGFQIPLTQDLLFQRMAAGSLPGFTRQFGNLDSGGKATAIFKLPPGAASGYSGRTIWFATAVFTPTAMVASSIAVAVELQP